MTKTLRLWLFDLDLAVDHGQLRRLGLERLPSLRLGVAAGRDDLVAQRPARVAGWYRPHRGPEMVERRTLRWRRMAIELGVELLSVGQLDDHALEALVIERLAGRVEHADTPDHLLQPLELVAEHAKRPGCALLRAAHQITFHEQLLARSPLGARGVHKPNDGGQTNDNRNCFHKSPSCCDQTSRFSRTILVDRFRSSHHCEARSFANFGIETLATY